MMVNPLATVFGIGDPNFPGFTSAPGLGSASALGFIALSFRRFRICFIATLPVMRANAGCSASFPASQELAPVVTVLRTQTTVLDLIEQTDVRHLDADWSVRCLIFHGKKTKNPNHLQQTWFSLRALPFDNS
jgi:hypothetical protein